MLYGMCFIGNSIADNIVTQMQVRFVMPQTAYFIHYNFAHKMPELADKIAEYASGRGVALKRPVVPANENDYSSVIEMQDKLFEYTTDFEKIICQQIKVCKDADDELTKKFLKNFLTDISSYTKMTLDLKDCFEKYCDSNIGMAIVDSQIEEFMGVED